jgi:parallel beta-helix repeat protein
MRGWSKNLVENYVITCKLMLVRGSTYGILLGESSGNTITKNTVSQSNYGVYVSGMSYDNDIHHNEVTLCGYAGIYLKGSDRDKGNIARQNTLTDNFIGIYSGFDSWHNIINENEASHGGIGLMMWTTFSNNVTNNIFEDFGEGIVMNWGLWGTFEGNLIENCATGFGIYQSEYNTFTRNVVNNSNVVIHMAEGGGDIFITDWNVFYHNDFVGGSIVIHPIFRNNVWDNSAGEGNYWSNYNGFDDGTGVGRFGEPRIAGDGIGDTDVPHLAVDWYPSMRPWVISLNQAPIAHAGGPYLVAVGQTIALDGSGSYDPDGDPLTYLWTQAENLGGFDDAALEDPSFTGGQPGVTKLTLTVDDGPAQASDAVVLVVYDPSAGFVTGGGWIDSPAGAYVPDPSLVGKASFGFVSQYKKGATVPTGNTEFVFQAGDLNFHSISYDWLVVNQNGSNAQFKGSGTINSAGNYKFMLWAGDGAPDTFRIKIWEENGGEVVVYDNGFNQSIGGGSIVVHTK